MIIYEGDSLIDGAPIVVIGTWPTRNSKTGAMVQFWILHQDIHPNEAIREGTDVAICGACKMRGPNGDGTERSCYVNETALNSIWKRYKRGGYSNAWRAGISQLERYSIQLPWPQWAPYRLTAYGDPGAVPLDVWQSLLKTQPVEMRATGWTGYTQLWREERMQPYRELFHASVFTAEDAVRAFHAGWRYYWADSKPIDAGGVFGVAHDPRFAFEQSRPCLHSTSEGRIQCDRCQACSGQSGQFSANVRAAAHGTGLKYFGANTAEKGDIEND